MPERTATISDNDLMAVRLLAMLLLASGMSSLQPLPGQAPNPATNTGGDPKAKGDGNKQPSDQTLIFPFINSTATPDAQKKGGDEKQSDKNISIITTEPLNVRADIPKDWGDKLNWILTVVLVLIGATGVRAALHTLKAIERQVTLQAASMTQWVLVENWNTSFNQVTRELAVDFTVANESSFPLAMRASFYFLGLQENKAALHTGPAS